MRNKRKRHISRFERKKAKRRFNKAGAAWMALAARKFYQPQY